MTVTGEEVGSAEALVEFPPGCKFYMARSHTNSPAQQSDQAEDRRRIGVRKGIVDMEETDPAGHGSAFMGG